MDYGPIQLVRISEYSSPQFDFSLLFEIDCIVDHIVKTLLIRKNTYVWDPDFGSTILDYLFLPLDTSTINDLKKEIESVAKSHSSVQEVKTEVITEEQNKQVQINVFLTISGVVKNFAIEANTMTREVKVSYG